MSQSAPSVGGALPAPPADPLHILPTWGLPLLLATALLSLLLLAWLIFRYLRRRRPPAAAPAPSSVPRAPVPVPTGDINTRIQAVEHKYLKSKAFRQGCHALADLTKSHLGKRTGQPMERRTSPEIAILVKDEDVGYFMTDLSRRRFGREEPRRKHFVEVCAQAREVLA